MIDYGDVFNDNGYRWGKEFWKASTLARAVKEQGCEKYKHEIALLDRTRGYWAHNSIEDIAGQAEHMARCMDAELKYPIIFGPDGNMMDGSHRIVKAVALGKKWIWAVRLKKLPNPDEVYDQ